MTLRFHFARQPPRTVINLVQGIRVGLGVVVNYRCVTSIILKRINVNQVAKEAMVYTGQVSREPYNDVGWNRGYSIAVPCRLYVRKRRERRKISWFPVRIQPPSTLVSYPFRLCTGVLRPLAIYIYIQRASHSHPALLHTPLGRNLPSARLRETNGSKTGIGSRFNGEPTDGDSSLGRNILKFGIKWEIIGSESIEHFP